MWTVCPDRFRDEGELAPSGSVCVTVTGHNAGSGTQHLKIPARHLTPANPTGKNQLCLLLKGPKAGRIVRVTRCQRKAEQVTTEDGDNYSFSDICVASHYNHGL